jgi:thiamine-phosphate pyrophosphorylase
VRVLRLIDASANRAAEALRVLEDLARFVLAHAPLTAELKALRHDLRAALAALPIPPGALAACRDVPADPGTALKGRTEHTRGGVGGLAGVNAGRAAEALRSLEEAVKALPADASPFESLRYRVYDAGARLELAAGSGRVRQWALCVVLTQSLCPGGEWMAVARAAIEGGADCIQLREKGLDDSDLFRRAGALVAMARPRGVAVVINDRADVALASGADGVHLGQADLPLDAVRRLAGGALLVGVSTESLSQAVLACEGGADYCGVGPMFATSTKDKPGIAGPGYVREYLGDPRTGTRPHLAIGGITPANAGELGAAGCRGIAVSRAVCAASDPASACRSLLAALRG